MFLRRASGIIGYILYLHTVYCAVICVDTQAVLTLIFGCELEGPSNPAMLLCTTKLQYCNAKPCRATDYLLVYHLITGELFDGATVRCERLAHCVHMFGLHLDIALNMELFVGAACQRHIQRFDPFALWEEIDPLGLLTKDYTCTGEGGESPYRGAARHQARWQALRQQRPSAAQTGHADAHRQQVGLHLLQTLLYDVNALYVVCTIIPCRRAEHAGDNL